MSGLVSCGGSWSQAYCFIKLLQTLLSLFFLSILLYEIIKWFQEKLKLSFILAIQILLVLSLIFNIMHNILGLSTFLFLESLTANLVFLTIFYYIGYNVLTLRIARIVLHCGYAFFVTFETAAFLQKIIRNQNSCKEILYLVINSLAIIISIFLFSFYWQKQKSEQQFLIENPGLPKMHSPFRKMWIMILSNILCSIISLGESIALLIAYPEECQWSEDKNTNEIINFVFALSTYYVGLTCTLIVLRDIRIKRQQNVKTLKSPSNFSNLDSGRGKLELIIRQSVDVSRSRSSSID